MEWVPIRARKTLRLTFASLVSPLGAKSTPYLGISETWIAVGRLAVKRVETSILSR